MFFEEYIIEKLNKGTTEDKLSELEKKCGEKLPKDFRDLYLTYNGESDDLYGLMLGFHWLSIDDILRELNSLKESAYEILSDKDGVIKEGTYRSGWIPFASDEGGSFLVMDLDPGENGVVNQVITIDRESNISYVLAENIETFLKKVMESIKYGRLKQREEDDVLCFEWENGHLFNEILPFVEKNNDDEMIILDTYWKNYFDINNEEGKILKSKLIKVKQIFIRNCTETVSLEILKYMINLKEIIIHGDNIINIEVLAHIPSLKKIVIGSKAFENNKLDILAEIKGLREVTLCNLELKTLKVLEKCTELKKLRLYLISGVDFSEITLCKKLKELSMESIIIEDFTWLNKIDKLSVLEFERMEVANLDYLEKLRKLTKLKIDVKVKDETNLSLISNIAMLKELDYPVGDMEILKSLIKLKSIGIDAQTLKNEQLLFDLNIDSITVYNATSEKMAKDTIERIKKYCKLSSYGWRQDWR